MCLLVEEVIPVTTGQQQQQVKAQSIISHSAMNSGC